MANKKKNQKTRVVEDEKKTAQVSLKVQPSVKKRAREKAACETPPKTLSAKVAELLYDYSAE